MKNINISDNPDFKIRIDTSSKDKLMESYREFVLNIDCAGLSCIDCLFGKGRGNLSVGGCYASMNEERIKHNYIPILEFLVKNKDRVEDINE